MLLCLSEAATAATAAKAWEAKAPEEVAMEAEAEAPMEAAEGESLCFGCC